MPKCLVCFKPCDGKTTFNPERGNRFLMTKNATVCTKCFNALASDDEAYLFKVIQEKMFNSPQTKPNSDSHNRSYPSAVDKGKTEDTIHIPQPHLPSSVTRKPSQRELTLPSGFSKSQPEINAIREVEARPSAETGCSSSEVKP